MLQDTATLVLSREALTELHMIPVDFPKQMQMVESAECKVNHLSRVASFTVLHWLLNQCDQPKFSFVFNAPLWSWFGVSRLSLFTAQDSTNNKLSLLIPSNSTVEH